MSPLPFRPGKVTLGRQYVQRLDFTVLDKRREDHVSWYLGVAMAPVDVDTTEPYAAVTRLHLVDRNRAINVDLASVINIPPTKKADVTSEIDDNDFRDMVIRLFGETLWQASCRAAAGLAALSSPVGLNLRPWAPEALDFNVKTEEEVHEITDDNQ